MFLPICELTPDMIVETKIEMPVYLVTKMENGFATLQNHIETYVDNDGYAKVINKMPNIEFMRNLQSGIIHATLHGRPICFTRHSGNSETVEHYATCEKCIKLMQE